MRTHRPLVLIGSGPGIGQHVASIFASNRFNAVALVARSSEHLAEVQKALEHEVSGVTVRSYVADVTETEAFMKVLKKIGQDLGQPECVYYNAAEITITKLLEEGENVVLYNFKTNCTGLYAAAKWALPQLRDLVQSDPEARPSLLVTSSLLPMDPIPDLFSLSMVKAAQRNMVQSLSKIWSPQGVHIGMVVVGGPVDPSAETLNPSNIASRAWELFSQPEKRQDFEVEVL